MTTYSQRAPFYNAISSTIHLPLPGLVLVWIISGLPVTRPAIRIGPLGIPRLLDEYIGDYALLETTKRILAQILVREPFVGGNRLQASRPDETRSHPNLTERDSLHELLANQFSSVAWNYVEGLIKLRVCFQWTIRKAVAWIQVQILRTKYHTARRLALGIPCFASSGLYPNAWMSLTIARSIASTLSNGARGLIRPS